MPSFIFLYHSFVYFMAQHTGSTFFFFFFSSKTAHRYSVWPVLLVPGKALLQPMNAQEADYRSDSLLPPASCIPKHEMTLPAFWNFSAKQISSSIADTKWRIYLAEGLNHLDFHRTKGTICTNTKHSGKKRITILISKSGNERELLIGKQKLT